jgi:transposase-like protein
VVGRRSGSVRLSVEGHADGATRNRVVREAVAPPAVVHTDDWRGYDRLAEVGCSRAAVCHTAGEWARDDDGDGVREVHNNTQEGIWTGLRNFLRPFRGVSKKYLYQYVAIFEWGYNVKRVTSGFIRALLGATITTFCPT